MNVPWVNAILHTGSVIQKKKVDLATAHSWKSVWLVVSLILLEIWLAIISIPLYLVESSSKNKKEKQAGQEYHIRRVITLSLLVVVGIIWLIKLLLAGFFIYQWNQIPKLQTQESTQKALSHDELFAINQAIVEPGEQLVTITKASETNKGTVVISGKAIPKSSVLVYITRSDSTNASDQNDKLTIVTANADAKGLWEVRLSEYRFQFLKGTYSIQALWYDGSDNMKSPLSEAKTFTIQHQAPTPENLIHQADVWLNILLLVFIMSAVVLTLILT